MYGGENLFLVDSKPIEVCKVAREKRCKMERTGELSKAPDFGFCVSQNSFQGGSNNSDELICALQEVFFVSS